MKNSTLFILFALGILNVSLYATTNSSINHNDYSYDGNSYVFDNDGVTFSIFPNGEFDFYLNRYGDTQSTFYRGQGVNISFNSGCDYGSYIQYDDYGAIVQIENTPIYYDYYGRVSRIGGINMNYSGNYIHRIGGLTVYYGNSGIYSHCSGYINSYNRRPVFRTYNRYFTAPYSYCRVLRSNPYRRNYRANRIEYTNYRNNYRSGYRSKFHHRNRNTTYRSNNRNIQSRRNTTTRNRSSQRSASRNNYSPRTRTQKRNPQIRSNKVRGYSNRNTTSPSRARSSQGRSYSKRESTNKRSNRSVTKRSRAI